MTQNERPRFYTYEELENLLDDIPDEEPEVPGLTYESIQQIRDQLKEHYDPGPMTIQEWIRAGQRMNQKLGLDQLNDPYRAQQKVAVTESQLRQLLIESLQEIKEQDEHVERFRKSLRVDSGEPVEPVVSPEFIKLMRENAQQVQFKIKRPWWERLLVPPLKVLSWAIRTLNSLLVRFRNQ